MEEINEKIKEFLGLTYDYGFGNGSGYGSSGGYGFGDGDGASSGYDGDGYGDGYGDGDGDGESYGDGSGDGSGYSHGYGDGSGSGYGLIEFNGQKVYYIDGVPTVIEQVDGNVAKGYICNLDLTTEPCYIVKNENFFAHGSTIKGTEEAARNKILEAIEIEENIGRLVSDFNLNDGLPPKAFYEWHHILTGSREFGRNAFLENHDINLEESMYMVRDFIELTKKQSKWRYYACTGRKDY